MTRFLLRRCGFFVAGWIFASILIFALIRLAGGDVAVVVLGKDATPDALAALRTQFGLDRPLPVQYFSWVLDFLRGDLGSTFRTGDAVAPQLVDRLAISLPLAVGGMVIAILIAIPLGTYAARYAGSKAGTFLALLSQVGVAIPVFWAGVLLSLLFGVTLGWLPTGGWVPWSQNPVGAIRSLILPCLALGVIEAAGLSRYVRSAVMDVLTEDYVRTARAGGMSRTGSLLKVGLPNAALPLINVLGVQVASLIGGAVIVEQVFSLPGLSTMIVSAVSAREVIVVQSVVMVLVTFVMVVNLAVDLMIGLLDPRVRVAR